MTDVLLTDPAVTDAALRLARLRRTNPGAADLAALCSLAVRVEPELLRRLRLLLPGADVSAEADLWASDVLSGASVRGISLDPRVAELLRSELAGARWEGLRERAWRAIAASHGEPEWHWSLRLEEQVYRLAAIGGPDGVRQGADLLLAALSELARAPVSGAGADERVGICRWLLGALARLPAVTGATDAADAARVGAGLHLDGRAPAHEVAPAQDVWLPWLLDQSGTSSVRVRVAFAGGRCRLNATGPEAVTIEVPATDPLVVDAQWHDGRQVRSQRVRFGRDEPVVLEVPADQVELSTLAGDTWRLARAGAGQLPGGFDFSEQRARHRPALGYDELVGRLTAETMQGAVVVVTGPAGTGTSVCAAAVADALERRGWIVAQHYFFVNETWDDPELVATSLAGQLRAAVPGARGVEEGDTPPDPVNRTLTAVATAVDALPSARGVVVLLDGPAGASPDEPGESGPYVTELLRKAMPSTGLGWIVATRHGRQLAEAIEETGNRVVLVDLAREDQSLVCRALVRYFGPGLRAAFGLAPDADGPVPGEAELITLSGTNPGRLRGIIDWLLDQRPGWARFEEIPVPLTVRADGALDQLEKSFATENVVRWLSAVGVALDGFTLGDALRLADSEPAERMIGELIDAAARVGLVEVSELPFLSLQSSVRPALGLADLIRARFGPTALAGGHQTHVAALRRRTGPATTYQVAASIEHALAVADQAELTGICTSGAYLDRRARRDGVAAAVDDLWRAGASEAVAEVLRAAETVRDAAASRPERFVEMLLVELRRRGAEEDLIEAVSTDVWPPPLQLDRLEHVRRPTTNWRHAIPVTAAAALDDGRIALASERGLLLVTPEGEMEPVPVDRPVNLVAAAGADVLAGAETAVIVLTHGKDPGMSLDVAGPVTSLGGVGAWVAAGTAVGTITVARWSPSGGWRRRVLVGHGGPVTVLAHTGELLLSGSVDGQVRVWEPGSGRCVRAYLRHRRAVRHIVGLSDGLVASADEDGRILCWNATSGATVRVLRGHDAAVTALFEERPGVLLSAGADGAIRRWVVGGTSQDETLVDHEPSVVLAALRPSGGVVTWDKSFNLRWWSADGRPEGASRPADVREPVHGLFVSRTGAAIFVHAGGAAAEIAPTASGDEDQAWTRALAIGAAGVSIGTPEGMVRVAYPAGRDPVQPPRSKAANLQSTLRAVSLALEEQGVFELGGPRRGTTVVADAPASLLSWDTVDGQGVAALEHWGVCSLSIAPQSVTLAPGPSDPTAVAAVRVVRRDVMADEMEAALSLAGLSRLALDEIRAAEGRLTHLVAAALRDRPGEPSLHDLTEPMVLVGDRQGHLTVFPDYTPVVRVSAAPITAMAGIGGFALIGTAEGHVMRWDPLTRTLAGLGRHNGPVLGAAALGARLAFTAGEDALLRIWDVETGVEQGVVAGQAPFRAVAAGRDGEVVVVRHGDDEVWFLRPDGSRLPPGATTEADLLYEVVPAEPDATEEGVLELVYTLTPKVSLEVRGAELSAGSRNATPIGTLDVWLDDTLRFADPVDATGRLLVPHRIPASNRVTVRARQQFPPDAMARRLDAFLRLTFVTPWSPVERTCEIGGAPGRPLLRVDGRDAEIPQSVEYA